MVYVNKFIKGLYQMGEYKLKQMVDDIKSGNSNDITVEEVETLIDELKSKSPSSTAIFISLITLVMNLITTWLTLQHNVLIENITIDHGDYMQKKYGIQPWRIVEIILRNISKNYNIITILVVIVILFLITLIGLHVVKTYTRDSQLKTLYEYKRYLLSKQTKIKS